MLRCMQQIQCQKVLGGGGGGANFHIMQELSVRVSWLCHAVKMVLSCLAQTTETSAFFIRLMCLSRVAIRQFFTKQHVLICSLATNALLSMEQEYYRVISMQLIRSKQLRYSFQHPNF